MQPLSPTTHNAGKLKQGHSTTISYDSLHVRKVKERQLAVPPNSLLWLTLVQNPGRSVKNQEQPPSTESVGVTMPCWLVALLLMAVESSLRKVIEVLKKLSSVKPVAAIESFHRKQSVKNGVVILDTHHSPPPYRLYGVSMWVEKNVSGFNPFSSLPLTSPPPPPPPPPPPCYLLASVSDQESLIDVPPPPPPPRKSEKKMKARKRPKRGT
ncbi:hypothetical protein OIU84_017819 [Salix udensis]|uniref:Uncharacterized protein n=1 Tax=Salix udensis TaxID=889485 RepID=A0AAD6L2Q2_9ROSI|nr:hypothetical protein OIU84_017819 [Salix udensis]